MSVMAQVKSKKLISCVLVQRSVGELLDKCPKGREFESFEDEIFLIRVY